jgi:hypothetical protein
MSKWESIEKLLLCFRTPDSENEVRRVPWALQHLPNLCHLSLSFQSRPFRIPAGTGVYAQILDATNWTSLYLPRLKSLSLSGAHIAAEPLRHLLFNASSTLQSVGLEDLWLRSAEWSKIFDKLDSLGVRAARIALVSYYSGPERYRRLWDPLTEQDLSSWRKLWENTNARREKLGLRPLHSEDHGAEPPGLSDRMAWWVENVPDS